MASSLGFHRKATGKPLWVLVLLGTWLSAATPAGAYSILHNFGISTSDGNSPLASLILDAAGNLYGTTGDGGPGSMEGCFWGCGTVFTLMTDGTGYTISHFFNSLTGDGAGPYASLILDPAGNFYGTTPGGGSLGYGTVFMMP